MGNPMQEGDYKKRLDIVCSLVSPVKNELSKNEKAGDATKATTYGDKEVANIQEHLVQEFMQLTVKDHDVKINDNGLVSRIVDGKEVLINEDLAKEIKERNQKLTAKKGPKIKDEKEGR